MYYGGRKERPTPAVRALLIGTGVFAGCAVGYVLYLLATVFPHMLHEALPNMTQAWFVALWIGALCVPILALRTVAVRGAGTGTRPYAITAIAMIVGLFVLDATGVRHVFPWGTRFYLTPDIGHPDPQITR